MSTHARRRPRVAFADHTSGGRDRHARRACRTGLAGLTTAGLLLATAPLASAAPAPAPAGEHTTGPTGGAVVSWGGKNTSGEGTVPPTAGSEITAIAAGRAHSLALTTSGSVLTWGSDAYGLDEVPEAARTGVTAIAAGADHSLALTHDGDVVAWGDPSAGQNTVPIEVTVEEVVAIAAGIDHNLALTAEGTVLRWNDGGTQTLELTDVVAIAAGEGHDLALVDGEVLSWGSQNQSLVPPLADGEEYTAISTYSDNNVALTSNGRVVAWGEDGYEADDVPVDARSGVVGIAAGQYHGVALKSDGSVVTWGGLPDTVGASVPVSSGSVAVAVAAGSAHSLAIVEVVPQLTLDSPPTSATVGQAYGPYTFTATGTPAPTFSVAPGSQLPPGLALDPQTGVLSGEPTTAGTFDFTVVAGNVRGASTNGQPHTVVVTEPLGLVTGAPVATATYEVAYEGHTFTATGTGTDVPTFAVVDGRLPAGLTLNPQTGELAGTPTETGLFSFAVEVTSGSRTFTSDPFSITVSREATLADSSGIADTTTLGLPFTYDFGAHGFPEPTFTLGEDAPDGMTIDPESGLLTWTPSRTGTVSFTVVADNGLGTGDSVTHELTVEAATTAPLLTTHPLPASVPVDVAFPAFSFAGVGSPEPTFTVSGGSLPAGLTLDAATGALSGTPSTGGAYNFTITASNGVGTPAVGSYSLIVTAPLVLGPVPAAVQVNVGQHFAYAFTATGFPKPHWAVTEGVLPEGLTLDGGTGVLTGTATSAGTSTFAVTASNGHAELTTTAVSVTVTAAPGAPTAVVATGARSRIEVSWAAPTTGGPVQEYEARSGNAVCITSTPSCVLGGTAGETPQVRVRALGPTGLTGEWVTVTSTEVEGAPTATTPPETEFSLTTTSGLITTAVVGQEITIIGTGFLAYSTVEIVIYSTPRTLAVVTTDGAGSFSVTITIPADLAPGTHSLVAYGVDAQGNPRSMRMDVVVTATDGATPIATTPTGQDAQDGQHGQLGAEGDLAYTGAAPVVPIAIAGLVLVAAGAVTVVATRRRRA